MEKIGFIGAYDKTDLIIQIAKILTEAGKRIIVIDATTNQKAKYIIPVINPTTTYVTEFENMDVAVGFRELPQINDYLMVDDISENYDMALIDVDSSKTFDNFDISHAKINYFVTSFDMYSLKRGIEIISGIKEPLPLKKVLFSRDINQEDDDYLNFLASPYPIQWEEEKIYFPYELGDQSVIIENQRASKIKFKNLSNQYKEGLIYIATEILGNQRESEIRKIFKNIEKGV